MGKADTSREWSRLLNMLSIAVITLVSAVKSQEEASHRTSPG